MTAQSRTLVLRSHLIVPTIERSSPIVVEPHELTALLMTTLRQLCPWAGLAACVSLVLLLAKIYAN